MLQDEPYNQKTDVWALGCILYEMVTSKPAFNEFGEEALRQRILSYAIPQLPTTNFESIRVLQDIYSLCMQRSQEDRPSVRELLSLAPLRE